MAAGDAGPRSVSQRKLDVLSALMTERDAWVATADRRGGPHMVPLAICWDGKRIIVQVRHDSQTARNATSTGKARLALGTTRHVVIIDTTVAWTRVADSPDISAAYFARTGWDTAPTATKCVFLLLSPMRIQAWRDMNEFRGRTIMRDGQWVG
jgi:hypothetical protein